ncbi:uncharacterized protein K452DRAFT_283382 [Aplosporella prunicola CBS 121167]|uniref:Uncharacterized protein n=1 Tax=Aplosporella prunicola CBS 121167 TaxID=1176127 RepID=A0A6A6BQR4_9PEZI|nr:uncharacterized protein K452DRAFT_283382 [Aplosporella prunicola CBS 121167]KAF2146098.1 hypothetical protein K452DRAFT_283382 [Aplosporella prunicola CBS 121167]
MIGTNLLLITIFGTLPQLPAPLQAIVALWGATRRLQHVRMDIVSLPARCFQSDFAKRETYQPTSTKLAPDG